MTATFVADAHKHHNMSLMSSQADTHGLATNQNTSHNIYFPLNHLSPPIINNGCTNLIVVSSMTMNNVSSRNPNFARAR
jgi:hypothetical protein